MECLNCHVGQMRVPKDEHPSYLECDACGAIELTYTPANYQEKLHTVPYIPTKTGIRPQIIGVFGGYGSGKSRASLQEFFLRCMENPNGVGLVTAPTLQLLKRTTIKTLIDEIIPPPLIESYNKSDGEIHLINGFTIYTIPSDDDQKLRSINAGLIHMEEASAINRSIYDQLLSRMRHPYVRNKAIFVCSNPEMAWFKDVIVDNEKRLDPKHPEHDLYNPFITCFIWPTKLNPYLPDNFIEINSKGKPEWWIRKYLHGSFEAVEGAVYPNFMSTVVDPFDIPKDWMRVIGMDHGLRNPTAVVFGAVDPKSSTLYIYQEYYVPNRLVPEHAKALKPLFNEIPTGLLYKMVADPSTKNKTDPVNGKSVQGLYQEYGIYWSLGNNNIEAGVLKVNSYVERGKLKVFNTCTNTVREHLNYKFPELSMDDDKNLDEKPVKKNEHSCFVAGTMVRTLHGSVPIEKIAVGSLVLTRQGYKPVVDWAVTGVNKETYTVRFSNGKSFKATGNHPVWVKEKGFVPVDSLRYGDIIITEEEILWDILKSSSTMGIGTDGIQIRPLFPTSDTTSEHMMEEQKPNTCTVEFTKTISDQYRKGITSTTKTETTITMIRRILKQFLHSIICHNTPNKKNQTWNTWNESDHSQLNGIGQKKVERGTENMQNVWQKTWKTVISSVTNAGNRFVQNLRVQFASVPMHVKPLGVEPVGLMMKTEIAPNAETCLGSIGTQKSKPAPKNARFVLGVEQNTEKETVYNITVADVHEYFANGILVSNCDALRYLCMTLPDDPDNLASIAFEPPTRYNRNSKEDFEEFQYVEGKGWEEYGY